MKEFSNHKTIWKIKKYANDDDFRLDKPFEEKIIEGNILLNGGISTLWDLITSNGGTPFDNANAQIGVGDSTVAEDPTQTGLLGANTAYAVMSPNYPLRNGTSTVWKAIFGADVANFAWNEFVITNGTVALNRKVSAQGTKLAGQTWSVEVTITLS